MSKAADDIAAMVDAVTTQPRQRDLRVVAFGEGVIRLTPPGKQRLERSRSLDVSVCGPELNTAVGLASLGVAATWVSALSESPLGRMIAREAASCGVDVSEVSWVSSEKARTGLRFVEEGLDPRPSVVHDDVDRTAMSMISPGTFDWERLLDGAAALHLSGVALGLSDSVRSEAMAAVQVANRLGVLVSFDLTYRPGRWSEADARQAFVEIIHHVDVLFASRGTLRTFFGIEGSYESVLRQAVEKLGVAAATVSRKRAKGSRRMQMESLAMGKSGVLASSGGRDIEVMDRLGAGDAFASGFLAGYLENPIGLSRAVSLAAAASALAYTMPGEFLCATREDVEALAGS